MNIENIVNRLKSGEISVVDYTKETLEKLRKMSTMLIFLLTKKIL